MKKQFYDGSLSLNKDRNSPFWFVTFQGPDGKQRRRSTKVPHAGGMFEGEKISAKLAEKLAYQRGVQMACAAEEEYNAHNNVSVRDWCESYITRNAGHISPRTVNNARTAYKHLYTFLGRRAGEPIRLQPPTGCLIHTHTPAPRLPIHRRANLLHPRGHIRHRLRRRTTIL